jgi:large subunit ribosomal protein L25
VNMIQLTAEKRKLGSKGYLKSLRADGKVPAILHGQNIDSLPLTVEAVELRKAMNTPAGRNVLLNLVIDGEEQAAMIENLQNDFLRDGVYVHVDLTLIDLNKKIEVDIPVVITGQENRPGDEGVVSQPIHEIAIMSAPTSIPENIKVDVSGMTIGDAVYLKDVELPEGCEAVTSLDEMLVNIIQPRLYEEEAEEEEEEELLEPELVGEEGEESEQEEEE